jgi:uncharacterized membrane protein YuzA (DUF378 family)
MMKKLDLVAASIGIVGGVNWLSIGAGKYDLVGRISGKHSFGETNLASRTLYGIIGGAALWSLARLVEREIA